MFAAPTIRHVGLFALLLLAPLGCGDETVSSNDPSPTVTPGEATGTADPTPTPDPTPTAHGPSLQVDSWEAMTTMAVADLDSGFDLDGDGSDDNGVYALMDALSASLIVITTEAIADQGPGGSCEASGDCPLTTQQVNQLTAAAELAIGVLVNVNTLNLAIQAPFTQGLQPYAIHAYNEDDGNLLEYWTGEAAVAGSTYTVDELLSVQSGHISEESRLGTFESAQLMTFTFGIETPAPADDDLLLEVALHSPRSEFLWNNTKLSNSLLGGISEIEPWLDYARQILDYLVEQGILGDDFDYEEALELLEADLIEASDISCEGDIPCFSMVLTYDAEAVTIF